MTSVCVNIWEERGYKFGNGEKLGVIRCQTRRPLVSRWYIEVICKYLFSFKGIITSAYEKKPNLQPLYFNFDSPCLVITWSAAHIQSNSFPGPFPWLWADPPPSQGKGPGNEVDILSPFHTVNCKTQSPRRVVTVLSLTFIGMIL